MAKIRWEKIRDEYITKTDTSFRSLAKKHKVSIHTLTSRAIREKWAEQREHYQSKLTAEIQSQSIQNDAEEAVRFKVKERKVIYIAFDGINKKLLNKKGEFNSRLKPKDIRDLTMSLEKLQGMMYRSLGIADKHEIMVKKIRVRLVKTGEDD
jgi:hypothetical protein